jgi:hypothetical protein
VRLTTVSRHKTAEKRKQTGDSREGIAERTFHQKIVTAKKEEVETN